MVFVIDQVVSESDRISLIGNVVDVDIGVVKGSSSSIIIKLKWNCIFIFFY